MHYDFDTQVPRLGTGSIKWDEAADPNIIPLWVADMDFPAFPPIIEALQRRVAHGVFGYTHATDAYYDSVINWFERRHGLRFAREEFICVPGVVPAISAIVRALTLTGDKVLVCSPVYNAFYSSIRNQGCMVEESPLRYANNTYTVDWEDFERRCADPRVRLFVLCNPHNPAGRVWTPDELQRMGDICLRHHVFVVADEIHCEIVMPGHHYTPFATVDERFRAHCAVCVAPTKAFNIAGLQVANILVNDPQKRERIDRAVNIHEVCDLGPFGLAATPAAYTDEGAEWLRQLNEYLAANYRCLLDYFAAELPAFPVTVLEGTYLVWVNCAATGLPSDEIVERLTRRHHVQLCPGSIYGDPTDRFVRINIACPRATLREGLDRMAAGLREMMQS